MSSTKLAVAVKDLSKCYRIVHNADRPTTLAEAIIQRVKHPLRRNSQVETFWAIQGVDFEVNRGDVVGIIGRNGAGKSTLLKILSRITPPTSGRVDLYGKVASLLEVGTGFHPELTGRENIYMNGALLGMRRAEITQQFDKIVEFSGVEQFLDTPVKRYSSGMYVRLAFSIAAHLNPDILIVDEVLAVGDSEFQKKCLGKMQEVSRQDGRTVLFVSHNMNAVASLCNTAVLLEKGTVSAIGETQSVIEEYAKRQQANQSEDLSNHSGRAPGSESILQSVEITNALVEPTSCFKADESVKVFIGLHVERRIQHPKISIGFTNSYGERIFAVATYLGKSEIPSIEGSQRVMCEFVMPPLPPGRYSLDIGVGDDTIAKLLDAIYSAAVVDVVDSNYLETSQCYFREMGQILVRSKWSETESARPQIRTKTGSLPPSLLLNSK